MELKMGVSGACFSKAYDVTVQRYCKPYKLVSEMHILQCLGSKLCENSKVSFEISRKIRIPCTAKYAFLWGAKGLTNYDIIELWHLKS